MKKLFSVLIVLGLAFGTVFFGCDKGPSKVSGPENAAQRAGKAGLPQVALDRVMAIQNAHSRALMNLQGVAGVATTLDENGTPCIVVLTEIADVKGIPSDLEGAPVKTAVSGKFTALGKPSKPAPSPAPKIDPTKWFDRPVPIGVSTGNEGECSAGTIGCRVKKGSAVYALSNNHVYALENDAPKGSEVLQPGLYDSKCVYDAANVIGTLSDFKKIVFSTDANNTIDAAIALSSKGKLGSATPSNGYGTPGSEPADAEINQKVMKYGRTTGLTNGKVYALNAVVNVAYSSGTARFVGQIIITPGTFSKAGDSGSLIVTSDAKSPIGLLFAGSNMFTIANPIKQALDFFNVAIDGQ